jgi:hypothetical protein
MHGVSMSKFATKDPTDYFTARETYALTRKQWLFCMKFVGEAECVGWKAAALTYGNADGVVGDGGSMEKGSAISIATQNMKKPNIVLCIQDLMGKVAMSANEVLLRLSKISRANIDDMLDIDPETGKGSLNLRKARSAGAMFLIKKLNFDAFGNIKTIEMHDAFAALTKMGQHHKLFDRNRENVPDAKDLARELLDDLRAKHEGISDALLVQKVLERFSGSGVTESDLIEAPDQNN